MRHTHFIMVSLLFFFFFISEINNHTLWHFYSICLQVKLFKFSSILYIFYMSLSRVFSVIDKFISEMVYSILLLVLSSTVVDWVNVICIFKERNNCLLLSIFPLISQHCRWIFSFLPLVSNLQPMEREIIRSTWWTSDVVHYSTKKHSHV